MEATFTGDLPDLGKLATLMVIPEGSGSGRVTSSPAGIDCGSVCSATFPIDSEVTLTFSPDEGSVFAGFA